MEERKNPLSNFRFVYRRSSPVVKILVIVAIVFAMLAVTALSWVQAGIRERTGQLQSEAAQLEQDNRDLTDILGAMDSVESVEQIAEEELDLVDPGAMIIDTE